MHLGEAEGSWLAWFQAPWQASINNTLAGSNSPDLTGWEPELHSGHWKGREGMEGGPDPFSAGQAGLTNLDWAARCTVAKSAPEIPFPEQAADGWSGRWTPVNFKMSGKYHQAVSIC